MIHFRRALAALLHRLADSVSPRPARLPRIIDTPARNSTLLDKAIEKVGSQAAFGRAIGVSQQRVWGWVRVGKPLPAEYVRAASAATGIPRHELRADLYDPPVAPHTPEEAAAA